MLKYLVVTIILFTFVLVNQLNLYQMKQTAVDFIIAHLVEYGFNLSLHKAEIKQAKEIEKQQIIDAYWDGGQDIPLTEKRCEDYYNETYNK